MILTGAHEKGSVRLLEQVHVLGRMHNFTNKLLGK